ncbi:hypothetical protein HK096_011429, partial [Nowakowskiella sp. JEL0078]
MANKVNELMCKCMWKKNDNDGHVHTYTYFGFTFPKTLSITASEDLTVLHDYLHQMAEKKSADNNGLYCFTEK